MGVEVGRAVEIGGKGAELDRVDCAMAALDFMVPGRVGLAAGVAGEVTAGGWTVVVVLGGAPLPVTPRATIDGSSSGIDSPANIESAPPTPGPIAAPTATPSASMPAASMAATRVEGRRGASRVGGGLTIFIN